MLHTLEPPEEVLNSLILVDSSRCTGRRAMPCCAVPRCAVPAAWLKAELHTAILLSCASAFHVQHRGIAGLG